MRPKRVTLKQISDVCGMSLSTVSSALNHHDGRYNDQTVEYIRAVASQLGYRVNQQAKILRGAKSGLLGIIKSISLHQITSEIALHAGEAIHAGGYRFFSSDVFWHSGGLSRAIDVMLDAKVEGVLIENQCAEIVEAQAVTNLIKNGIPVVLVEGYPLDGLPFVSTDHYEGFFRLTEHLVACGHQTIALAVGEHDLSSVGHLNWRTSQAIRAVKDATGQHSARMEFAIMTGGGPSEIEEVYFAPGRRLIHKLAAEKSRPSAIIFLNDLFAVGALRACADLGIRVPEDIAIAGCDNSAIAGNVLPGLTSIAVPAPNIGREAVRLLIELIQEKAPYAEPPRILLRPDIAIRESSELQKSVESPEAQALVF